MNTVIKIDPQKKAFTVEKLPRGSQTAVKTLNHSNGNECGTTLDDLIFSDRNGAYSHNNSTNERFTNAGSAIVNDNTTCDNSQEHNIGRLSDFDRTLVTSKHDGNYKLATQRSTGMNGYNCKEKSNQTKTYSSSHDLRNGYPNGKEERNSKSRYDTNEDSQFFADQEKSLEYAATQTTEAILAKIFGENTKIPQQRYFNGGTLDHRHHSNENCSGIECDRSNSSIPPEKMRNKRLSISNSYTALTDNSTVEEIKVNGDLSETGFCENAVTINGKEIDHKQEFVSFSRASPLKFERNFKNFPALNGVTRLHQGPSTKHRVYNSFESDPLSDKFSTFKDTLLPRFESTGKSQAVESLSHSRKDQVSNFDASRGSVVRTPKEINSSSSSSPRIQSNVVDYYDKLKTKEKAATSRETSALMVSRKGLRTKSSELPVKNNLPNTCSAYR